MDAYRAMTILHVIASVNPADGGPIEGVTRQSIYSLEYGSGAREVVSLDPPDAPWVAACPLTVYAMGAHSYEVAKKYRRLPWIKYGFSLRFVKWLRENAQNYDGIVVNGLWNFIALGFVMALGGRKVDYVVYTHGMLDPWFQKTYPLKTFFKQLVWLVADGRLVNSASAVLFTSEEERELARNAFFPYHPREKVVAYGSSDVPEGAAAQAAAFQASVPHIGNRKYLLYLSRIHPKKGCDLLIEAFARVSDQYPELDLVIAGPDQIGMVKELQALADRLGIGGRIHWPGMLTGDAKWGAFRQAEAFILPSHQENFGIVVAEAMACGTPALISNKVNIWREVEASGGGMVEPDTTEGAYRLMSRFLTLEPAARQNMSVQARAGYDAHFSIGSAAEALEKTIFETKRSWSRPRLDA